MQRRGSEGTGQDNSEQQGFHVIKIFLWLHNPWFPIDIGNFLCENRSSSQMKWDEMSVLSWKFFKSVLTVKKADFLPPLWSLPQKPHYIGEQYLTELCLAMRWSAKEMIGRWRRSHCYTDWRVQWPDLVANLWDLRLCEPDEVKTASPSSLNIDNTL